MLVPGIRTGFIVAPEPIRRALVAARHLTDWHGPQLIQATLAKFIQEGHLARHIRKMRRIYSQRRQLLFQCLESDVFGIAEPWPSAAGLHIAVRLNRGLSGDEIANAAKAKGVGVDSLGPHGLALGYGAIEISQIEEGARRLMRVIWAAAR